MKWRRSRGGSASGDTFLHAFKRDWLDHALGPLEALVPSAGFRAERQREPRKPNLKNILHQYHHHDSTAPHPTDANFNHSLGYLVGVPIKNTIIHSGQQQHSARDRSRVNHPVALGFPRIAAANPHPVSIYKAPQI